MWLLGTYDTMSMSGKKCDKLTNKTPLLIYYQSGGKQKHAVSFGLILKGIFKTAGKPHMSTYGFF